MWESRASPEDGESRAEGPLSSALAHPLPAEKWRKVYRSQIEEKQRLRPWRARGGWVWTLGRGRGWAAGPGAAVHVPSGLPGSSSGWGLPLKGRACRKSPALDTGPRARCELLLRPPGRSLGESRPEGGGGRPPATISAARPQWGLSQKTRFYRSDLQPGTAAAEGASPFQCGRSCLQQPQPPRPGLVPGEPGPAAP